MRDDPSIIFPRKYDIVPLLTEAAQSAAKEKVIRVIVATFRVRDSRIKPM